jgi:AI-2 transport protein TqsA
MLRTLITLASLVVIFAGIRAAAALVVPFLLALFLAILLTPAYFRLKRTGLPNYLALMIVITGLAVFLFLSMTIFRSSLDQFITNLPSYEAGLSREFRGLMEWLATFGVDIESLDVGDWYSPQAIMRYAGGLARSLSLLLGQWFFIFIITAFMLIEASGFHAKIRSIEGDSSSNLKLIDDSLAVVRSYVSIKSLMSLLTGSVVALWLFLLQVDNFLFMGLLAFLLNFVPNIGSFIAAIPGIILALIIHGPVLATVTAIGYFAINIGISNVIEPRFVGNRLGISPLIVLVSLVFWGWMLGPAGMLLSVPLTMFAKMALESSGQTRSLALFLGPPPTNRHTSNDPNLDEWYPTEQAVGLEQLSGTELELRPIFRSFEANIGNI